MHVALVFRDEEAVCPWLDLLRRALRQFRVHGADVQGVFPDLLDRGDPGERQEEAEMIGEFRVVAGNRFAILRQTLGLKRLAIGGEDELDLLLRRGRAVAQCGKRGGHLAFRTDLEVDIVPLEDAVGKIRLVGAGFPLGPEPLEGSLLVSEGFEKGVGKSLRIEGLFREP